MSLRLPMQMHCKRCQTKIPAENTNQGQHIITCPECSAVLPLDSPTEAKATSSLRWSNLRMPKGMAVEPSKDELLITRRWFSGKYIFTGFVALVWNGFMLGVIGDLGWGALFIPHVWVGVGMAYYALAGFLNSSEITVSPNRLRIKHGPLPAWGNKKLDPIILRQLYSKERKHRQKNSVSYTYEVHMLTWDGRNKTLLKKLDTPQQALFIEQEIEHFLRIKDEHVVGELSDPAIEKWVKWEAWQKFAKVNNLTFNSGKLLESFGIYGNYQGYNFRLSAFRKHQDGPPYTRFAIAGDNSRLQKNENQQLTTDEIIKSLNPTHAKFSLQGEFRTTDYGREIAYERKDIPTNIEYLQFAIDSLYKLIDRYPKIVSLGGETVPILQPIAIDKDHPLHSIASQLIQDIAPTTLHLRDSTSLLICKRCLAHTGALEAELSWLSTVIYYGCRICGQSNDFYFSKSVIAVLDSRMPAEPVQQHDELRINWLARRELFDFDAVEIVQATDEDVERFAVQVGNDTDPARQPHYKTMECVVAEGCALSENTIRILRRIFGPVKIGQEQPV